MLPSDSFWSLATRPPPSLARGLLAILSKAASLSQTVTTPYICGFFLAFIRPKPTRPSTTSPGFLPSPGFISFSRRARASFSLPALTLTREIVMNMPAMDLAPLIRKATDQDNLRLQKRYHVDMTVKSMLNFFRDSGRRIEAR